MSLWIHPYFDLETGIVIKGQPLGTEEGVGCGEVLVSLESPVSSAEQVADLVGVIHRASSLRSNLPRICPPDPP